MKIAVVTSGHIPSQWAHSFATLKKAYGFKKLGHDVEVLTVERFFEERNRRKIKNVCKFYGVNEDIAILYFKDNPLFYLEELKYFKYILWLFKKITKNKIRYISDPEKVISEYCKQINVDICYCRTYRTAYYNIKNGIYTIMDSQTTDTSQPDLQKVIELSRSKYFRCLVTVSDILKQNFIRAGVPEDKVLVLWNGIDLDSFQNLPGKHEIRKILKLEENNKIVTYCGSLFPDKGIEHILLVAKNIPRVMFLLAGGTESQITFWKNYINSYKIKNVYFTGFVEGSKVPLYLRAADVLIMPYKTDQKIKIMDINTTCPLKLFEYMASKRPIVSTKIPAISRIITDRVDGLLAQPNNIKELTNFVEIILNDTKLAKNLATNAYNKVRCYDWKNQCEKMLEFSLSN